MFALAQRRALQLMFFTCVGGPPLIGIVVAHFTHFGHSVKPNFMEVLAQILAVIVLADIIETKLVLNKLIRADGVEAVDREAHALLRTVIGVFLVGESSALYSVAVGRPTSFLVVTTCVCGLILTLDLAVNSRSSLGIGLATTGQTKERMRNMYALLEGMRTRAQKPSGAWQPSASREQTTKAVRCEESKAPNDGDRGTGT
jgi:hypothetical protein